VVDPKQEKPHPTPSATHSLFLAAILVLRNCGSFCKSEQRHFFSQQGFIETLASEKYGQPAQFMVTWQKQQNWCHSQNQIIFSLKATFTK